MNASLRNSIEYIQDKHISAGINATVVPQKQIPAWVNNLGTAIAQLEKTSESFSSVLCPSVLNKEEVETSLCELAETLRLYTERIERINRTLSDNQL
jgi:hypothetical protein